ncbi:Hypothetical Protein SLY_0303 [Strawberry lethal yellows phytoplasma (CPA) str. NZSb11]|uniref:Uncharacterized protein n=1 Tax=Strawberry lethal yellows phytoplasma (CPA) str. NZSb11 TaxID=980422 RepID=R4RLL3_PHYAS|nr:Hypothetical Protein SLY_0303 [Strawberry lethal yellows phytoplasma (CPA) str. NZSb11]
MSLSLQNFENFLRKLKKIGYLFLIIGNIFLFFNNKTQI